MTTSVADKHEELAGFNFDHWFTETGESIVLRIKNQFLALPDRLRDAVDQEGYWDVCLLHDIDAQMRTLNSLSESSSPDYDYDHFPLPDSDNRARNVLSALHCRNLSGFEPDVVNGLPGLIILAYDLEGDFGETLFGAEGQREVLDGLRSFTLSEARGDLGVTDGVLEQNVTSDTDAQRSPFAPTGEPIDSDANGHLFSVDDWLDKASKNIISGVMGLFAGFPDHLHNAAQKGSFDACRLDDIDRRMDSLKSLSPNYELLPVPDRDARAREALEALHCENLSGFEPDVVNGLPELIILAYDLEGDFGEALFGAEGQREVLDGLRSFQYSAQKRAGRGMKLALVIPAIAALAFIGVISFNSLL